MIRKLTQSTHRDAPYTPSTFQSSKKVLQSSAHKDDFQIFFYTNLAHRLVYLSGSILYTASFHRLIMRKEHLARGINMPISSSARLGSDDSGSEERKKFNKTKNTARRVTSSASRWRPASHGRYSSHPNDKPAEKDHQPCPQVCLEGGEFCSEPRSREGTQREHLLQSQPL